MKKERVQFKSIGEFYPYYLLQHRGFACRMFHFAGTGLVILLFILAVALQKWWLLLLMPLAGYGFAWTGHFLFEKNKPAAFGNPFYSLICDFIMFRDILTGKIGEKIAEAETKPPHF